MVLPSIKNPLSYVPFQIFVGDDAGWFSTGTGFSYQLGTDNFIITNWHVISGRDWPSGNANTPNGRRPTKIWLKRSTKVPFQKDQFHVFTSPVPLPIFSDDKPNWLEHPELGWKCDLVAFQINFHAGEILDDLDQRFHKPVNHVSDAAIPVAPGSAVFIIGYPKSISSGPGLPIYKSGYIASEPDFDAIIDGIPSLMGEMEKGLQIPAFYIDSLTREGMSGSPVFASYSGIWNSGDPYGKFELKGSTHIGSAMQFIGCYSGRATGERETDAALGLCWRESVIREICELQKPGTIWELHDQ